MGFYLYKGLKKPLVFFGLKDKYIYYAIGSAVGGLVSAAILSSFIGIFGSVAGLGIGGLGIWWIFKTQDKKGLYNKTRNDGELHIFPKKFKIRTNEISRFHLTTKK
ncbi:MULTISPECIES: DUF4133 domain-containing protein [Elizabethkingia]|uniref:DUF4133 domain-containing protein n=1 Tax=Elizabethkingia anophelis TaxID=1117645 RepID=A0A455ZH66_9FLAO|nr:MULTISPECIES: DUF4133 domain-containing protein [Elizabethkingia]AQW90065.1 DUF4133 domain-containing protein [Elizabethkingia anophelis]KUY23770.1 hypothetical protein ATB94_13850 [Elizabethkingia anophelis]OPC29205.1 DUF4133 domain-containing protein [Elizabethkingia miricola]DAC76059.1 TPA_exp: hypothetical protein [Elizabethkingia anophelis]DAC76122.1 TPA_exp: hypothetical protein [Elizabethkingia anophelis]